MGFLGMDLLAVNALGRQLDRQAGEVAAITREIEALIEQTQWSGADRERFASDWASGTRPAMHRAADLLRDASRTAFDEAKRQEETSRNLS